LRLNLSLLGMCAVDAWFLYAGTRGEAASLTQDQFYEDLFAQLIGDIYNTVGLRQLGVPQGVTSSDGAPLRRFGVGFHLTSTLKRRKGEADRWGQHD